MWVTLTLSALPTTLGQVRPWGRAFGPKVAKEAREQGPGDGALDPAMCWEPGVGTMRCQGVRCCRLPRWLLFLKLLIISLEIILKKKKTAWG